MDKNVIIGIYGRGGQGVITAANILGQAILLEKGSEVRNEKFHIMIIPHYGPERTGGLVKAVVKAGYRAITDRSIEQPTHLIIFDKNNFVNEVIDTLKNNNTIELIIVNCLPKERENIIKLYPDMIKNNPDATFLLVDATLHNSLNLNITMLAYFIKETRLVSLDNFKKAIIKQVPKIKPETIKLINAITDRR